MYQAYINYLVRKAQEKGEALTAEENSFLEQAGVQMTGIRRPAGSRAIRSRPMKARP
jgi:hypothetical protein